MTFETPKTLPLLQDLYAAYGIEARTRDHYEQSEWEVPADFGKELEEIMTKVATEYRLRPLPPFPYAGVQNPPPDIEHAKLQLYQGPLRSEPSIQCSIFEVAGISSMVTQSQKEWALWLNVTKEGELLSDGFLLHTQGGEWNFSHRLVPRKYRGKKLFGHLAHNLETFVQVQAQKMSGPQTIYLTTAQPDVVLSFLKRGYTPSNAEESVRLSRMLDADPSLFLAPAHKPDIFKGGNTHLSIPPDTTSLYCFERSLLSANQQALLRVDNAFRIKLQKKFRPYSEISTMHGKIEQLLS